jgi:hypothetical protein
MHYTESGMSATKSNLQIVSLLADLQDVSLIPFVVWTQLTTEVAEEARADAWTDISGSESCILLSLLLPTSTRADRPSTTRKDDCKNLKLDTSMTRYPTRI